MLPTSPPKNYKISSAFSYNFRLALTVYQTVSSIKVLDKERLAVRFKDGTEIEQEIVNMRRASA